MVSASTTATGRATFRFLDGVETFDGEDASALLAHVDELSAVCGRVADHADALLPDEREGLENMAPRRAMAYSSGRRVAREALYGLGLGRHPVSTRQRVAIWPDGVAGSIAHSRDLALAMVGHARVFAGIGVDLERESRVGARVAARVLTGDERAQCTDLAWATLLFSGKEAVYKAVNPALGEYLAFGDVEVTASPEGTFQARTTRPRRSTAHIGAGRGYFLRGAGQWMTIFLVPSSVRE